MSDVISDVGEQKSVYCTCHLSSVLCRLSSVFYLRYINATKTVPQCGRGPGDQYADIAKLLMFAIERDAGQCGQVMAMLGKNDAGARIDGVLKPSSEAMRNSRGPADVTSPTG